MAESNMDRLMDRIKQQTMINGAKAFLSKNPKFRMVLPLLHQALGHLITESDNLLGDADRILVIGRKNGVTNLVVIDGKKPFTLSTGLDLKYDRDKPETIIMLKSITGLFEEVMGSGIFDEISEEDKKKASSMISDVGDVSTLLKTLIEESKPESGEPATTDIPVSEIKRIEDNTNHQ